MIRALDENGDIVTSGSQFKYQSQEVAQAIKSRMKFYYGEWFLDVTDGTPWHESILGVGLSLPAQEAIMQQRVAGTPNVLQITRWDSQYDRRLRKLSAQCGIIDAFGQEQEITISEGS